MRRHIISLLLLALGCSAATVDRVALVVGKTVFTQSEVEDEARLSQIEGGKPLELSAATRKQAAERLVDQQLLRDEMQVTGFQNPSADGDALVRQFRQQHFASIPLYQAALTRYGVTEDELKQHLLWEVAVLRFTERRFTPMPADTQAADRAQTGAQNSAQSAAQNSAQPAEDSVDRQMETWLKQQRSDTRIVFKQEAFQ
jgi:hypothetical protein